MALNQHDIEVSGVTDRPISGMHHCGRNPCWITVTHIPTQTSVRVHSGRLNQHKTREIAMQSLELVLDATGSERCLHPEQLAWSQGEKDPCQGTAQGSKG